MSKNERILVNAILTILEAAIDREPEGFRLKSDVVPFHRIEETLVYKRVKIVWSFSLTSPMPGTVMLCVGDGDIASTLKWRPKWRADRIRRKYFEHKRAAALRDGLADMRREQIHRVV